MTEAAGSAQPVGRVRRSRHFSIRSDDAGRLIAVSALAGRELYVTLDELQLLTGIPEDTWVAPSPATVATVARLAECGLVVSEEGTGELAEHRRREAQLRAPAWNRHAALFHAMTRWDGVRSTPAPARLDRDPDRWPPPPHFHTIARALRQDDLPPPRRDGYLFDVLRRRRTTVRGFAADPPVGPERLSTILHWVWGSHGTRVIVPGELQLVRKTSPSGGAQHSIEVYPLVRNVDGIDPGLYHYSVQHHALELVDDLPGADIEGLNLRLLADQDHFAGAAVTFFLTCRFGRTFWKYPRHAKAYKVVLFDAAHLSQTFQLVCTELGLGSFVTAAFNEADVDELLRLPAFTEGALLAVGCGHPAHPDDEPVYQPVPRSTPATEAAPEPR